MHVEAALPTVAHACLLRRRGAAVHIATGGASARAPATPMLLRLKSSTSTFERMLRDRSVFSPADSAATWVSSKRRPERSSVLQSGGMRHVLGSEDVSKSRWVHFVAVTVTVNATNSTKTRQARLVIVTMQLADHFLSGSIPSRLGSARRSIHSIF